MTTKLHKLAAIGAMFLAQALAQGQSSPRTSFDALSRKAEQARDEKNFALAITLYQRGVNLNPKWEDGWWNLGSITYDLDRFPECAAAFQHLAQLRSDSAPAWIMEGLCEYRLRNFGKALESLRHAEQLEFAGPHELARLGRLHYALVLIKTGSFEKAITTLSDLTKFDRKTPEVVVASGIAGLREPWLPAEVPASEREKVTKLGDAMGSAMELDYKAAIEKFEGALAAYPADANIHFRFGGYLMTEDPDRGVAELKRALELNPQHLPALLGLAAIYTNRGEAEPAKQYAQQAVGVSPEEFAPHVALGRALLAADDAQAAVKELQRAVELAPQNADVRFNLASAYTRLGRRKDALHEQEEFRRLKRASEPAP